MSADKDDPRLRADLTPEDRAAIERRSAELGRRLEAARQESVSLPRATGDGTSRGQAMGRALRVSAELLGGIVVGSFIGLGLDRWLGLQKPWFFILFFLLGATAGILNVIRMAMREKKTPPLPSVRDDGDKDR
jgi:ATP synthase protein I